MLLSNFGMPHIHLENKAQTRTIEQPQLFDACPCAYTDTLARQSMVDEKGRGAACAVTRNFGLAAVGVDQPDRAISILPLAVALYPPPTVCATPGVATPDRAPRMR